MCVCVCVCVCVCDSKSGVGNDSKQDKLNIQKTEYQF